MLPDQNPSETEQPVRGGDALRLLAIIGFALVAWWSGSALGERGAASAATHETPEEIAQRLVGQPIANAYFTSGDGRSLVEASRQRPVAVLLIQWSECLSCAAEMVEWARLSRDVPHVAAVEVMTRRLPPDAELFLRETGIPIPVRLDSSLVAGALSAQLPVSLLLSDGRVQHALVGYQWSARFWADVAVASTLRSTGDAR